TNRTRARAEGLAARAGGRSIPMGELPDRIADVDVLLTSTGSRAPLLERDDVVEVMALRPDRPLLVVDIAVPRDVDPAVADVDGVTLLDMDDLRRYASAGIAERRREVAAVEAILAEELDRYLVASSAREVAPLIVALRERAEHIRAAEVARHLARGGLDGRQSELIEAVTKGIVAKLVHQPTVVLKDAAGSPRGDGLVAAQRELLEIES